MTLCLAAVKPLAVDIAVKVNVGNVVLLCGAVGDLNLAAVAAAYVFDLRFDICRGDALDVLRDLDALVVLDLDFRLGRDLCGHGNAVFVDGGDIKFRLTDDVEPGSLRCFFISRRQAVIDCLFIENARAVHLLDQVSGRLALSEPGDGDVLCILMECAVVCGIKSAFSI